MRRAAILIAALAALAVPATASAKEITKVKVCGTDGCVSTHDPQILQGLTNGGPPTIPPRDHGRAVRLRASIAERPGGKVIGRFTSWFIPRDRLLVGGDGTWMLLPETAAGALRRVSAQLAFFPASRVSGPAEPAQPRPAAPAAHDDGGGVAWPLIAALGAVLAAGAALLARRLGGMPWRGSSPRTS
jgi:hypothetical protein